MNNYSYLSGPWDEWAETVDDVLAGYDAPAASPKK